MRPSLASTRGSTPSRFGSGLDVVLVVAGLAFVCAAVDGSVGSDRAAAVAVVGLGLSVTGLGLAGLAWSTRDGFGRVAAVILALQLVPCALVAGGGPGTRSLGASSRRAS